MKKEELSRYVNNDDAVIDVGANVGEISQTLSELVGQFGHVIAIEPGPKTNQILKLKFSGKSNVTIVRAALGDAPGRARVFHHYDWTLLDEGDPRRHSNVYHDGSYPHLKEAEPFDVEILTLDTVTKIFDAKPSFVKIDVDGWEARVIRGASEVIHTIKPIFIIEIGKYTLRKVNDVAENIAFPMLDAGYKAFNFSSMEPLKDVEAILKVTPEGTSTVDVLFLPR